MPPELASLLAPAAAQLSGGGSGGGGASAETKTKSAAKSGSTANSRSAGANLRITGTNAIDFGSAFPIWYAVLALVAIVVLAFLALR